MLQCVAVSYSALQCAAVCCSVLQCVAVRCSVLQCVAVCYSVLQCVAMRCNALQSVAVRCSASHCVAVCCSMLQCVAVRCSALQCVAMEDQVHGRFDMPLLSSTLCPSLSAIYPLSPSFSSYRTVTHAHRLSMCHPFLSYALSSSRATSLSLCHAHNLLLVSIFLSFFCFLAQQQPRSELTLQHTATHCNTHAIETSIKSRVTHQKRRRLRETH